MRQEVNFYFENINESENFCFDYQGLTDVFEKENVIWTI